MNANEYVQQLISNNGNSPAFDDLRHMAQNVATVCDIPLDDASALVSSRQGDIESAGLVAA